MSVPSKPVFATMEVRADFEVLGIVAALIENALTADTRAGPALMRRMPDSHSVAIDLAWLTHRFADNELPSLRGRAKQWGLPIARAIHDAISQEVSERRSLAAIRKRERLDAVWFRQTSKRYRAAAIKRIQARARTVCGTAALEAFFGAERLLGYLQEAFDQPSRERMENLLLLVQRFHEPTPIMLPRRSCRSKYG